jgi:hypothetical protein
MNVRREEAHGRLDPWVECRLPIPSCARTVCLADQLIGEASPDGRTLNA